MLHSARLQQTSRPQNPKSHNLTLFSSCRPPAGIVHNTQRLLWNTVDCIWNVMARAQKPDFVFRRNGRVHLNRRGRQFSRLLAAEVCVSAVLMLDASCSEVVWRVLATHSIRQFPLHLPSHASSCAITFQLDYTNGVRRVTYCMEQIHLNVTYSTSAVWSMHINRQKIWNQYWACMCVHSFV